MMKYYFKAVSMFAITGLLSIGASAQADNAKDKITNNEEIIITQKGDKDAKITVEIKDGDVTINGKPMDEFNDKNVSITRRKLRERTVMGYQSSPFRSGAMNLNNNMALDFENTFTSGNKALLGVVTEKADNGVKITSITKGSAAEKAGLKEEDIITKIDDASVNTPEELTKAIGKFKPEDKTVITYKRDKKDQKANVVLGKRANVASVYMNGVEWDNKMANADVLRGMAENRLNMARGFSIGPRLGIKAQDTEDEKGVKVLDVADASAAEKAGIKEGDIITEFDGHVVNSASELADAAREAKDKNSMKLKLNRDGKVQQLEVKIPKKLKTANL